MTQRDRFDGRRPRRAPRGEHPPILGLRRSASCARRRAQKSARARSGRFRSAGDRRIGRDELLRSRSPRSSRRTVARGQRHPRGSTRGSVTPATSHALARMRDRLGDPLLVRAGQASCGTKSCPSSLARDLADRAWRSSWQRVSVGVHAPEHRARGPSPFGPTGSSRSTTVGEPLNSPTRQRRSPCAVTGRAGSPARSQLRSEVPVSRSHRAGA